MTNSALDRNPEYELYIKRGVKSQSWYQKIRAGISRRLKNIS